MSEIKRLFLAFEVHAAWPAEYPEGRILAESDRHLTVAFFGNVDFNAVLEALKNIPLPPFLIGLCGRFDKCLFLPTHHPHVVAWRIDLGKNGKTVNDYIFSLQMSLANSGFKLQLHKEFLPHVTLCRSPFKVQDWKKQFSPLPCIVKDLHLYESLGHSQYKPIWSYALIPPFEEIEHTADIAYKINGENLEQLQKHAITALSFRFPQFLNYIQENSKVDSLEMLISNLNAFIAKADGDIGCPIKAVSYHGTVKQETNYTLSWEMIVDV